MAKLSERALAYAVAIDADYEKRRAANEQISEDNRNAAPPGSWYREYTSDDHTVTVWKSAIVGGDELKPGGKYILQRTTPKSPAEFELGKLYTALRSTDGEFIGEVIDEDYRTFVVGAGDLFTTY